MNSDPEFHEHWWRSCEVLHNGEWGRVHRLFYHIFYGEGLVLHPGMRYERDADDRPCAGTYMCSCAGMHALHVEVCMTVFFTATDHTFKASGLVGTLASPCSEVVHYVYMAKQTQCQYCCVVVQA